MALSPGTTLGVFEILGLLGAGGMGEVYRARDTKLNRDVAIKVLPEAFSQDAERLARFTREAQTLAALNHPNIAHIYGIEGPSAGSGLANALVMELVEGDDLSALIARGPMPIADVLSIARQIAEALEAAHDHGIIHRDLKPANIKVRADGTVKVLDFGLAKALDPAASGPQDPANSPTLTGHATQLGMILGTAAYMSPEQARGKAVDRRADIWAFGVVVYEMLTGARMFPGGEVTDVLAAVLRQDVDWAALPPNTPKRLRTLLERCLDRGVKQRLRDIGEARVEIAKIESGAPDSVSSVMPAVEARTTVWLRLLPWTVAAVAVAVATVLAINAYRHPPAGAAPVWLSISPPVSEFGARPGPALSRDGLRLAFTARDTDGKDHLWVRALNAQSGRAVPATEGATSPFWSWDGQSVGFFRNQKLEIVGIDGGSPQVLAAAVNPRGASWGPDGVILFVPAPSLGIYRVPAVGGAAEPVQPTSGTESFRAMYPSFLPDGRNFLYVRLHEREYWVTVGSLDGTEARPLLKAHSRAEYANGYILFGSKGALYAQPFDAVGLTLSGDRTRVVDAIGFGAGDRTNYAFSPARDVIAAGHAAVLPRSQLTWVDGRGTPQGVLGEAGQIFGFSVARDRMRAVVERIDPAHNSSDPWIIRLDTGFATALRASTEGSAATSPVWSHDGSQIFHSDPTGLRILSPSRGTEDHWPIGSHWPLSSAPLGESLLVAVQSAATGNDLMLVPLTGDHTPVPYLQTSFDEGMGRFSPNGGSVAYVSNESSRDEVYVQSFPQPGNKIRISTTGGRHPEWSEDGRSVYFLSTEPDGTTAMMVARNQPGGTAPRRLFDVPPGPRDPARSVFAVFGDGRRFLINAFVPVTAPQVITIGLNWTAALKKGQ